jgi:hypothetical protein
MQWSTEQGENGLEGACAKAPEKEVNGSIPVHVIDVFSEYQVVL